MNKYAKFEKIIKEISTINNLKIKSPFVIGICGSFGRGDFSNFSNLNIMFISENLKTSEKLLIIKEKIDVNISITIYDFSNIFKDERRTKTDILSSIIFLTETIPIIGTEYYWKLYKSELNFLRTYAIPKDLVNFKINSSNITTIRKYLRIKLLLPKQIKYVEYLKIIDNISFLRLINSYKFSRKMRIIHSIQRRRYHEL